MGGDFGDYSPDIQSALNQQRDLMTSLGHSSMIQGSYQNLMRPGLRQQMGGYQNLKSYDDQLAQYLGKK